MDVSLRSGPRLFFPSTDVSVQAKVSQRWFGGTVYSKGFGFRVENNWYLGRRTWTSGNLERMQLRNRNEGLGEGPRWNATQWVFARHHSGSTTAALKFYPFRIQPNPNGTLGASLVLTHHKLPKQHNGRRETLARLPIGHI